MIRTIAKHSYIRGRNGRTRARKHLNYIAHRAGHEREFSEGTGGRRFFNRDYSDITVGDVKHFVYEKSENRGVVIHTLILSPGIQSVDIQEYTREIMQKLEHEKRLDLEWSAVVHENTQHKHAHVVILGKDRHGYEVRLTKSDHRLLRQFGDEYLDREHKLERYLDREIPNLLRDERYDRGGDELFRQLVYGRVQDQDRGVDVERADRHQSAERDRREFEEFDDDMRRALNPDSGDIGRRPRGQQRIREQQGRLSEFHGDYVSAAAQQRLGRIAQEHPELAELIRGELEFLHEISKENRSSQNSDLDRLLGFDQQPERKQEEVRSAWKTFESDRELRDLGEDREGREEDEIDRRESL